MTDKEAEAEDAQRGWEERRRVLTENIGDERILKLLEAWDYSQFSDINLSPAIKQILYDGLQAVYELGTSALVSFRKSGSVQTELVLFNYDLSAAPSGQLQLLTAGMTRRIGEISSATSAKAQGVIAWAPVAGRVREEEIRLGHISPPRN